MNKIKIINLPEITAADNTTYIPVSSGAANATRKISVNNLIGVTSPIQAQLDSKAPKSSPTFSGAASFSSIYSTGAINSEDTIYAEQQITGNRVMADEQMIFGPDAVIKIITGYNGITPVYREFPATELSSSDLNGTNYVMVYGTGTPTENAAELQAAYNEAKKMPRHLGTFNSGDFITIYKGQTFVNSSIPIKFFIATTDFAGTIGAAPAGTFAGRDLQSELDAALSRRVSVIVAPGEYNFGASAFVVDAPGINIVSLTGNSDVIISSTEENLDHGYTYGIKITADYVLIKGINCITNTFYIESYLYNIICEHCTGGNYSFGMDGVASGTFNDCIGGDSSFGTAGTASGTFTNCTGGDWSFGSDGVASGIFNNCIGGEGSFGAYTGNASGTFNNCVGGVDSFGGSGGTINAVARLYYTRLTSGTFPTPEAGGRLIHCIDGNNNVVNYPILNEFKTSQVVNGLTDTVDTSKDIIIYNNNDALNLPSAASMINKRITIKNNLPNNAGNQTMEFTNSIGGTPANRTIQRKFGCPDPTTFLVIGSVVVVGANNTEMIVDSVAHEYITVTADIPADISIGNIIAVDTPITIYSDDFTDGLAYKLIYAGESKDFYSDGVNWFVL